MPLWLSESDVRAALPMGELIEAMEAALIAFSAGRVVQPVRTILEIGERNFFGVMPALDADGVPDGSQAGDRAPREYREGPAVASGVDRALRRGVRRAARR